MTKEIKARLEELRVVLREECISYSELAELQGLAEHIEEGDVELLQWAGVPEFPEEKSKNEVIAEFMGLKQGKDNEDRWKDDWFDNEGLINGHRNEYLRFDTSWDWLMPVVEKCYDNSELADGTGTNVVGDISHHLLDVNITETYKAVVVFINWYNEREKA